MSEGLAIKLSEKESMLKSFILFFVTIELFLVFIFYFYSQIQQKYLDESLFLEMKNYSLFFDDDRFDIDIVDRKKKSRLYELIKDDKSVYILTAFPASDKDLLKVMYPIDRYDKQLHDIWISTWTQFLLLSVISVFISLLFSYYSLSPIRQSLKMMEMFIRDIIHDLNTPLANIVLNLKMMNGNSEESRSIKYSIKTISMLHSNLDNYLREIKFENEKFYLGEVVKEQVEFFSSGYGYLKWSTDVDDMVINANKDAFSRIIYNLLSNACKYNTSKGYIDIYTKNRTLVIENSADSQIVNRKRVFERFYKEGDRGLGIGLHIVYKLSRELDIKVVAENREGSVAFILFLDEVVTLE